MRERGGGREEAPKTGNKVVRNAKPQIENFYLWQNHSGRTSLQVIVNGSCTA